MDPRFHGDASSSPLGPWTRCRGDREVLALNVLLLGEAGSGRSSVGNALIGGHEFPTGVSMTMGSRVLSRNFPAFFRRKGAESDLLLRVVDTPPGWPCPHSVLELCPDGVHVLAVVVRADVQHKDSHVEELAESLFGPDWRLHAILILTHADHLEEAGLHPSVFLTQASDWLRALAEQAGGGAFFMDNSCNWPTIRGRPLRERILRLSAKNHHAAAGVHLTPPV